MPLLEELATYLQQAGQGTIGQSLFMGPLPLDIAPLPQTPVLGLLPVPGAPPVHAHNGARYEHPVVQVLVRGVPHGLQAAWTQASTVWGLLDGVANQTLSGTAYLLIQALQSPWWLKTDDYHRPHLIFNVRCARAL